MYLLYITATAIFAHALFLIVNSNQSNHVDLILHLHDQTMSAIGIPIQQSVGTLCQLVSPSLYPKPG